MGELSILQKIVGPGRLTPQETTSTPRKRGRLRMQGVDVAFPWCQCIVLGCQSVYLESLAEVKERTFTMPQK